MQKLCNGADFKESVLVPIKLCMRRCRFQRHAVVPIKCVNASLWLLSFGWASDCDGADQIVYAAVLISRKCSGADQMCETRERHWCFNAVVPIRSP